MIKTEPVAYCDKCGGKHGQSTGPHEHREVYGHPCGHDFCHHCWFWGDRKCPICGQRYEEFGMRRDMEDDTV